MTSKSEAFTFKPPRTCRAFMLDKRLVRAIVGPVGSAKTSTCLFELFRRAATQEPDADGVRPTRFAIIRNTLPQLKTTVLPDIKNYFGSRANWVVSESTVKFHFPLADGTQVQSDWLFIPLDSPDDVRRLLSLQLTGAFIEEFREVDYSIVDALIGRIGRYPSLHVKPTWQGLIMSSNPYPDGSAWHAAFEVNKPDGWVLYRQPSGRSPQAENVENLPEGYYERLMAGASPEFVRVHVDGLNGSDMSGQAVFGSVFDWHFHSLPYVDPIEGRTSIIGMDVDRNPAALIAQRDVAGRLIIHEEVFGESVGMETFIQSMLIPILYERYPGHAYIICDPAAVRRSSISEESQLQALHRLGFDAVLAPTNKIEPRLRAIDNLFTTALRGDSGIVISREGCPMLIRSLQSEYKYPRSAKGDLAPTPVKSHPWSDLVDALSYLALGFTASRMGRPIGPAKHNVMRTPPPSPLAWT